MIVLDLSILNQKGTPMFNSDTFANRPAFGIVGRIFISTDTKEFFRDTGTSWELIGGPGSGTITGSGTIGTLPIWTSSSALGNSTLIEGATLISTTKDIKSDAFYLTGAAAGNGALYWTNDRVTLANYNAGGSVEIEVNGGTAAQTIAANLSTTFFGNIIRNGGLSTQFLKADGSLDSNTYNTGSGAANQVAFFSSTNAISGSNNLWYDSTNSYLGINTNTPGNPLDVHGSISSVAALNQTTATNNTLLSLLNSGTPLWRIGNFYTAGANDFGVFDVVNTTQQLTIVKATGQTFIGAKTTASGRLVVNSATADAHLQIVGANAPSIRIDNAGSGGTQRFVFGLATATNNFIQGATAGEFCISTQSAGNMLFGMWQTTNASEVMRITTTNNLLIGSSVDNGNRFQVTGSATFSSSVTTSGGGFIANMASTNLPALLIDRTSTSFNGIIKFTTGGVDKWILGNRNTSDETFRLYSYTAATDVLTFVDTGAATFSSSIAIGNSVAAAVAAPSTHKVSILIGGVQYYLLASNV